MAVLVDKIMGGNGGAMVVVLDRPAALNALTLGMIDDVMAAFQAAGHDDAVRAVVMMASAPSRGRAFCAGGDVKYVMQHIAQKSAQGSDAARDYFTREYALDKYIYHFSRKADGAKPVIAVMDGITMGGGVGLANAASIRIATAKTRFAMPEVKIGLFPDVAGTYFLNQWPGNLGRLAAISGAQVTHPCDLRYLGIATHYISDMPDEPDKPVSDNVGDHIDAFLQALSHMPSTPPASVQIASLLRPYEFKEEIPAPPGTWAFHADDLTPIAAWPVLQTRQDIAAMRDALSQLLPKNMPQNIKAGHLQAQYAQYNVIADIIDGLTHGSPSAILASDAYYAANAGCDYDTIIARDHGMVDQMIHHPDFQEGVTARLIQKRAAIWL